MGFLKPDPEAEAWRERREKERQTFLDFSVPRYAPYCDAEMVRYWAHTAEDILDHLDVSSQDHGTVLAALIQSTAMASLHGKLSDIEDQLDEIRGELKLRREG